MQRSGEDGGWINSTCSMTPLGGAAVGGLAGLTLGGSLLAESALLIAEAEAGVAVAEGGGALKSGGVETAVEALDQGPVDTRAPHTRTPTATAKQALSES